MKKIYLTAMAALISAAAWSQCESGVTASQTSICPGDSVQLFGTGPVNMVTTTFAAGNNHRGNMFDIVATNTVTIESFDAHPMGTTDYEIYYRVGGHAGFETSSAGWTLVGSATGVAAQPQGTPTPIPINVNVTIPAGQTYAFYVTSSQTGGTSLNYTNGSTVGNVFASDANISFLEGVGMEYPFANGGSFFSPRVWNGNIHYSIAGGATTFLWSTGSTNASDTVVPTATTTYYVDITPPGGCPTVTDSVTIVMNTVPIVDLGPDTSACQGVQVTLDAGNPGATFSWNGGVWTQQVFNALPGTSYNVTVTNAEGCSSSDTIDVAISLPPPVDLGADQAICDGETITLDAGNFADSYLWDNGDTTQTITVGPGTYSVTVSDAQGCSDSDNITITSNPNPTVSAGNDTTICVNHSVSLDAGAGFAGYNWSSSETTQTITVDGGTVGVGTHPYTVEVTDSNGCSAMDTVVVNVDACAGITELASQGINVYPNPANSSLVITTNAPVETEAFICNSLGQKVMTLQISGTETEINVSQLENGAYYLVAAGMETVKVNILH